MSGQFDVKMLEFGQLEVESVSQLKLPKKYSVLLHNDDYTPMGFVIELLKRFFFFSDSRATEVMLQVHHSGKADCGVFTRDIAETKVALVNEFARQHEYPLLCSMQQL